MLPFLLYKYTTNVEANQTLDWTRVRYPATPP